MRQLDELRLRAAPLAQLPKEFRDQCIELAQTKSPSAVFELAQRAAILAGFNQMEALGVAKATRWLTVIRRDYGQKAFEEAVDGIRKTAEAFAKATRI